MHKTQAMSENQTPISQPSGVEPDDVSIPLLTLIGTTIAVSLLLIAILLQAWYYSGKAALTTSRALPADNPQMPLGRYRTEQQEQLGQYRWINREAKVVGIPIERAMELVAREMAEPPAGPKK